MAKKDQLREQPPIALLYLRVSTKEQLQNLSMEVQEGRCREWCDRQLRSVEVLLRSVMEEVDETAAWKMREFLIEMGREFCFIGSEVPLQVGTQDFALDLLFFHHGLNCPVAVELKVGPFEPEYLGTLNFYLEAN